MIAFLRSRFSNWDTLSAEVWNVFKYGVVGVTSVIVNTLVYALLSRWVWPAGPRTLFSVTATIIASVYNFILHHRWTFNARTFDAQMVGRYLLVAVIGTIFSGGLFYVGHEMLHIYDLAVVVGTPFIVAGATYFLHRWYTFHPKHNQQGSVETA